MAQNLAPIDALVRRIEDLGRQCPPDLLLQPEGRPRRRRGASRPSSAQFLTRRAGPRAGRCADQHAQLHRRAPERGDAHRGVGGRRRPASRRLDVPVLQAVLCTSSSAEWEASSAGLTPRDTAMNVVSPSSTAGSTPSRSASRKPRGSTSASAPTIKAYVPKPDRVDFVVAARLELRPAPPRRRTPRRRVAILFGNYPTKNARIGNGVGLDTPASVMNLLRALQRGRATSSATSRSTAMR